MRIRRAGLTIVEVLLTLVLVAGVLGPIFVLMSTGTKRGYRGGDETLATLYATEIVETIRGAPFGAFQANDQPMSLQQIFNEHNVQEGIDISKYEPRFSIQATVSAIPDYDPRDMKKIEVLVGWKDRATGQDKSVVLATFYTPVK